jgi:zinc protease
VNGTPDTVAGLAREQIVKFYRQHAVAKNGVLAVFGDVKAEEIRELVERLFADLPSGEEALRTPRVPPVLEGSQRVRQHKNKAQAVLMVAYRGCDLFSPDRPALELIDEACSDLGSRFFVRIREKMGLAYFVGSSQMLGLVPGPFGFYLGTAPEKVAAVEAELLDEIGLLAREGLTAAELGRAREKALGQIAIRNQSEEALAYSCALDELYGIGYGYFKTEPAQIEAVTLEQVRAVARKYFLDKPRVIAIVTPESHTAPVPDAVPGVPAAS